jgi:hypothetical protein
MREIIRHNQQRVSLYYFGGDFYLSRDGAAFAVVLSIDDVIGYDLREDADGALVLTYTTGGEPVRVRSRDGGRTWA